MQLVITISNTVNIDHINHNVFLKYVIWFLTWKRYVCMLYKDELFNENMTAYVLVEKKTDFPSKKK